MALAVSRYFLPVTRELMISRGTESPLQLCQRAGIPKSPAYRVVRFYEVHGAVRTHNGLRVDPRRILTLQGGLRADRAVPDRELLKGPPLDEAIKVLDELDIPYAVGFQTAANMHSYFEPSGAHTLYIEAAQKTTEATRLTAHINSEFARHPAASGRDRYELYVDDLARLDVRHERQKSITSPMQTLLDLAIHSRSAAHKEFFYDQLCKQEVIHG